MSHSLSSTKEALVEAMAIEVILKSLADIESKAKYCYDSADGLECLHRLPGVKSHDYVFG